MPKHLSHTKKNNEITPINYKITQTNFTIFVASQGVSTSQISLPAICETKSYTVYIYIHTNKHQFVGPYFFYVCIHIL